MVRAIWSGSISFGPVNVPVKVFSAIHEHAVHFHQVEKGTGARIRYEKVSERSGREVPAEKIQLGFEVSKGTLVTVDQDQLQDLKPRTTRTIDIFDFVQLSDIDPVFYDRTYWLAPDGEPARRPYALLVRAMEDRRQVGIGTMVMRNKQYLAAIRPRDEALALSTMHFADEVVPQPEFGSGSSTTSSGMARELHLAAQIIDALSTKWDPGRYKDTYTDQVKELIGAQAEGKHVVSEVPAQEEKVIDLMAALEASLKAARKPDTSPASRTGEQGTVSRGRAGPSGRKGRAAPPAGGVRQRRGTAKSPTAKAAGRKSA